MKTQFALYGLGIGMLISCSQNKTNLAEQTALSVDSTPTEKVDFVWQNNVPIQPQRFTINTQKESVITTESGSEIQIPADAFVDANGNPVSGEVDIIWKEFHTIGDQLLSNINMCYDSAGVQYPFISGGMFDINGAQNGAPIYIAENLTLQVDLVSKSAQKKFNFYQQDPNSGAWTYVSTSNGKQKTEVSGQGENIDKTESTIETQIFDAQPKNIADFEELNPKEIAAWQVIKPMEAKELNTIKNYTHSCYLNPNKNDGVYQMTFVGKKDTLTCSVQPYTFEQAAIDTKKNKRIFDKQKTERNEAQEARAEFPEYTRSIPISSFAVYNWDVCARMSTPQTFYANFNIEKGFTDIEDLKIALVCLSDNYQVQLFATGENKKFTFDSSKKNTIVAIDLDNKIYVVDPKEFQLYQQGMTENDLLSLKYTHKILKSADDIDAVISKL